MKCIDTKKFINEINDRLALYLGTAYSVKDTNKVDGLNEALEIITSLQQEQQSEYVRKDMVVDAIKLAYGKVSMNPFDCSDAFEELLKKIGYEIH